MFTDSDVFNLLCALCMTRSTLLTTQGTFCAVNCVACLLRVALISDTDTYKNPRRIRKMKKINWGYIRLLAGHCWGSPGLYFRDSSL